VHADDSDSRLAQDDASGRLFDQAHGLFSGPVTLLSRASIRSKDHCRASWIASS
jgi:hypothetical protein